MKLWAGRFQKETDTLVNDFNSSIDFDARLYKQDIAGSIAHARMLGGQGIIEEHEAEKIVEGLKAILADIEAGAVEFSADNEDIHMNIETILTQRIGDAGKRLHTARSRNDQVAVDTRLYVKEEIPVIIGQVLDLENEEAEQVTPSRLKATDAMKTGALIKAACIMGCIMGEASPQLAAAAQGYAEKIGLAFQLTDDMLDVTGTTEELGKPAGSDKQQHKATYVSLYGLEQVEAMAKGLLEEAKACLKNAKVASAFLYDLTDYILYRKN